MKRKKTREFSSKIKNANCRQHTQGIQVIELGEIRWKTIDLGAHSIRFYQFSDWIKRKKAAQTRRDRGTDRERQRNSSTEER